MVEPLPTDLTVLCPSYPDAVTPSIRKGISTVSPDKAVEVSTVMVVSPVTPSPERIEVIPTEPPLGPTIRVSSITGSISTFPEG